MAGASRRVGWRVVTPRSRGALSGFGLVLLGIWGALIPFVGPYWNYAYSPNSTWTWTAARFWLEVLPGAATFLAGLVLLVTAARAVAWLFALLGVAAGAWFVVGPLLAPLWRANYLGSPVGDRTDVSVEAIGIFYGLGAAIIVLAAFAMGRFSLAAARDLSYEGVPSADVAGVAPAQAAAAPAVAAGPTPSSPAEQRTVGTNAAEPVPQVVDPMAGSGSVPDQGEPVFGTQSAPARPVSGQSTGRRRLFGSRDRSANHRHADETARP